MPNYSGVQVDARGIKQFAREMRAIDRDLGKAVSQELRSIGNVERDKIRRSTAAPYGPVDSQGKIGRKRQSIKTSVRAGGVSLYSTQPDAGVWEFGGKIRPRGVPITIPQTAFVRKQVDADKEYTMTRLAVMLEGIAERYAGFK